MSPEINALIESLLRRACAEDVLVAGFMASNVGPQPEMAYFTTARERGHEYAELYRRAADLIDEQSVHGCIREQPLTKVM